MLLNVRAPAPLLALMFVLVTALLPMSGLKAQAISEISPSTASVGKTVMVTGTGFTSDARIILEDVVDGTRRPMPSVFVFDDKTNLEFIIENGTPNSEYNVIYADSNGNYLSSFSSLTVVSAPPPNH